jgi:hypothetical protein
LQDYFCLSREPWAPVVEDKVLEAWAFHEFAYVRKGPYCLAGSLTVDAAVVEGTVNLVCLAKLSVEEAVDVGLAGSLAVDAAVVEAIVVVEVGLVATLMEDATLLIVNVLVKEAILLIVDALAAL